MIQIIDSSFVIDGVKKNYAGFIDYSLYYRYLQNPDDIRPVLQNRKDTIAESLTIFPSANMGVLNVLGMGHFINRMYPSDHPNFYTAIPNFIDLCAEYGFLVNFLVFADAQEVMPDLQQQLDHFGIVCSFLRLRGDKVLVQLGNEWQKNGFDPLKFNKPDYLVSCRGSAMEGYPILPAWDFSDYHTRRGGIKGLAACGRYIPFVVAGDPDAVPPFPGVIPVTTSEWLGAAEHWEEGRRTNRPGDHYNAALAMGGWGAGGCFHSDNGLQSVIFEPVQRACALAFFMAMAKIDPAQRFISYPS